MGALKKYKNGREFYAEKYSVSLKTISRLMKDGAPLDDEAAMGAHWAAQKHKPAGVSEKESDDAAAEKGEMFSAPVKSEQGAGHALKRLEEAEAQYWEILEKVKKGGREAEIKNAHDRWLKTSEQLRRHDLVIEESRRGAGELIPREKIESMLREFTAVLYAVGVRLAESNDQALAAESDPLKVRAMCKDIFWLQLVAGIAAGRLSKSNVPDWVIAVMTGELKGAAIGVPDDVEKVVKFLKAL